MELKTYFAQDRAGNVIPGGTATIYITGTNTLATGLQDSAGAAISNPITADSNGEIQFKAPDGIYDMQIAYGSQQGPRITFQCLDHAKQVADVQQAAADTVAAKDQVQEIIDGAGDAGTLVVLAQPGGAGRSGMEQGGTIQDALNSVIDVEMFKHYNTSDSDWGPAFRAAILYAANVGFRIVTFSGVKNITSFDSVGWVAPFDDGTIDSRRTTDSVMAPENQVTFPVYLNLPSDVSLHGRDPDQDKLVFGWSGDLDTTQAIGICKRVLRWDGSYVASTTSLNRMNMPIVRSNIGGFSINQCMIGVICDGIESTPLWGDLNFNNVAIPIAALGFEAGEAGRIKLDNCLSGVIGGGWWLQRNDVQWQGGLYIPPYTSNGDIQPLGWVDSFRIRDLRAPFPKHTDSSNLSRYLALDAFFDKYFWKTANSTLVGQNTPIGEAGKGRLSTYGSGLTTGLSTLQADNPFRGISMRAVCYISRYNRGNSNNEIFSLKTRYTPRGAIWLNNSGGPANIHTIVHNAYIEDSGKVSYSSSDRVAGGSNDWFSSGADPWNKDKSSTEYYIGQGYITTEFINNTASIVCWPSYSNQAGHGKKVNTMTGKNDGSRQLLERTTLFDPTTGTWSVMTERYTDYDRVRLLSFTSDTNYATQNMFKYSAKDISTSDLALFSKSGSVYTPLSPNYVSCRMERVGNRVKLQVYVTLSSSDATNSGQFVIGVRRYSIYDISSRSGLGQFPLLGISKGSFKKTTVPTSTSGVNISIENSPKSIKHNGYITISGLGNYHAFEIYSDHSQSEVYPVSNMTTAAQMTFLIDYESLSAIDSITLTS